MRFLKTCLYTVGFFTCYALFVHVNAQTISGGGGWSDLEWLGKKEVQATPTVTLAFSMMFTDPLWALFNVAVVGGLWFFEFKFLRLWQRREKR